jgi:hypothetical protein
MKHTPGKWKQNVDTVWRGGEAIVCHPLNSTQSIADARLVAAAPDLLFALVMAKNWMDVEADYGKDKWEEHDQAIYDDIMESINNAIKKATS